MARTTKSGLISGVVGKLAFYEMNGNQYARLRPVRKKKKRNEPPNELTTVFGTISKYGSAMLSQLSDHLLFPFTLLTYNRQRTWLRSQYVTHKDEAVWELKAKHSLMSQVNPDTDLRDFWENSLTVTDDGEGIVSITIPPIHPKRDLKTAPGTKRINFKVFVLSSPFKQGSYHYTFNKEEYSFAYSNDIVPVKKISMDTKRLFGLPTVGNLAIVVIALEFETGEPGKGIYNTDKKWLPAAIVAMGRLKD